MLLLAQSTVLAAVFLVQLLSHLVLPGSKRRALAADAALQLFVRVLPALLATAARLAIAPISAQATCKGDVPKGTPPMLISRLRYRHDCAQFLNHNEHRELSVIVSLVRITIASCYPGVFISNVLFL